MRMEKERKFPSLFQSFPFLPPCTPHPQHPRTEKSALVSKPLLRTLSTSFEGTFSKGGRKNPPFFLQLPALPHCDRSLHPQKFFFVSFASVFDSAAPHLFCDLKLLWILFCFSMLVSLPLEVFGFKWPDNWEGRNFGFVSVEKEKKCCYKFVIV